MCLELTDSDDRNRLKRLRTPRNQKKNMKNVGTSTCYLLQHFIIPLHSNQAKTTTVESVQFEIDNSSTHTQYYFPSRLDIAIVFLHFLQRNAKKKVQLIASYADYTL